MGYSHPNNLTPQGGFTERDRIKLQRFISGLRIVTKHIPGQTARVIKKVTGQGAQHVTFKTREGASMTVAVCTVSMVSGASSKHAATAILPLDVSKES